MRLRTFLMGVVLLGLSCRPTSLPAQSNTYDSGGLLLPEQAAYDVTFYDLALRVDPDDQAIAGMLTVTARIVAPTAHFVLDLDALLAVEAVEAVAEEGTKTALAFERREGRIWASFPYMKQPGDMVTVAVRYGGQPREAPNPPWDGGFTWAETPSGQPWIATSCQTQGADVWWPVKDHVSDEPDSMALHITVPDPLVVASNGALREVEPHDDGTSTYHWFISTPINTYNVALNIAPYRTIEATFESVAGDTFPVTFWVLPEDYENGQRLFPEILEHLRFFEETVGPYPFRADKYGVAQTPHLGMEHQTIIAYGAGFNNAAMTGRDWGFDALHHHELAHEWWGNLVTNAQWSDMWLHEGFGTYMQALYAEYLQEAAHLRDGEHPQAEDAYHAYMDNMRGGIANRAAMAPREVISAAQVYGGDIYVKGAWVLHTLRFLIGEDAFRTALRRMAYPDPERENSADGCACRFATTDDFLHLTEEITGQDLDWFFEIYTRQPDLPRLVTRRSGAVLELEWETPQDLPFPMPVDVQIGTEIQRVTMPDGRASLTIPDGVEPIIDPRHWILRDEG